MGYWTWYQSTYCGKKLIGDEENIKHTKSHKKENKHNYTEMSIPCCFSAVNEIGKHITNCTNLPTKLDEDNVQVRYFCDEHMIKVKNIRRKMVQKYINEYKEKIIKELKKVYIKTANQYLHLDCQPLVDLIINLESGKFD